MSYDPESEMDRLCCKLDETEKERDDLLARVKELESNCAAMVKVIECAGSHDHSDGDEKDCVVCAAVNSVLDKPNPGQYLIDQLHQRDTALVAARKVLRQWNSRFTHGPTVEAIALASTKPTPQIQGVSNDK